MNVARDRGHSMFVAARPSYEPIHLWETSDRLWERLLKNAICKVCLNRRPWNGWRRLFVTVEGLHTQADEAARDSVRSNGALGGKKTNVSQ